jgi:hypothetical protein
MTGVKHKTNSTLRVYVVSIALGMALGSLSACSAPSSRRMADGKEWTARNLNVETAASYCYADAERNCRQYGRLYTW